MGDGCYGRIRFVWIGGGRSDAVGNVLVFVLSGCDDLRKIFVFIRSAISVCQFGFNGGDAIYSCVSVAFSAEALSVSRNTATSCADMPPAAQIAPSSISEASRQ